MKLIWLIVFILLLLSQLFAFMAQKSPTRRIGPVATSPDSGLTELAARTCEFWREELEDSRQSYGSPDQQGHASVLDREQLMLQLRDAELALLGPGEEVRISAELETWIDSFSGNDHSHAALAALFPYISGLLGWLEYFSIGDQPVVMERSFLAPESTSSFPCLSFELIGSAPALGSFLLDFEERFHGWHLKELDMNRDDHLWWLRGSYAFGGDGL